MLRMYFRTSVGVMWETTSTDNGDTWAEPSPMDFPNNNSKVRTASIIETPFVPIHQHISNVVGFFR